MAKYENIRALAKKQLQAVTESSDRWKAFLRTAAIAYNYSFPNQLLIHEQSPTATAVADIAYWNNNAGRWVKRGAHGIAVFDTRANSSRLRYLFDISDTIPRAEIPEALPWVITDQNWRPVWDKIVADNHADSIQSALLMLSTSCVAQRSAMFTTALGKAIDGSSLQWAKPDEQRQLFLQLITQSCLYMAALRCGVDTARLDLSALESVNQFDTNRITLCLGSACQQAARPLMQQIGSITREIDSVARAEKVRYYGDKQEETNNTKEVNNGVHDGERLPNPGADAERAADAGNREVRQPAAEIPAGERPDDVRRDAAGGNAVPASGGDGQRSTPANRADDADADAAEHRPEPADRPDGLDAVDERLAEPSRGTGDAADLQPVTQEPQAESDTTPSAFSVPISDLPPLSDELILGLLAKESSSRADNAAILEYFNEHPDLAERSAFCKHCYKQIYTYLFVDDHTVGFIRHDMYLELWEGNYLTKTAQVNLTWDAVAAKIADLIEQGRLMVPIKAAPVQQQMEQLTLTPEDSEKAGLPSHEQQAKSIDLAAEVKKWNKPVIDASGKYITEQDITDALCKGGGFEDSKFRIQQNAYEIMMETKQRWRKPVKDGNILAYHIIQSFAPGEATPDQVHQIGCEFAQRFLADRFECTVSTHLDRGHLHNHIVVNSVSYADGKMFRSDFNTYYKGIRETSDELCRENRLSVIETDGKGKSYDEWLSGQTGKPTIRGMVRKDVEQAIAAADSFDGFILELQNMGYTVKYGPRVEHMAVRHKDAQRNIRIDRLDPRFSETALREYYRQLHRMPTEMQQEYRQENAPAKPKWQPAELQPTVRRARYRGKLPRRYPKVSGFMACYYHYCALLRKAYHGKATKRCYFLLREDFLLFSRYQQQTKFLWENHIETMDELLAYKENAEVQIQQLARQRKVLYRQKREPERAAREEKIKSLTQQMKALRHEVYICSDIETDAAEVQEKLRQAELAAQEERNEVKQDEQRRRSSRSDGAGSLTGYRGGY